MRTPRKISCVLAAYNEALNLGAVLAELAACLRELPGELEIVVVNDGSSDDTRAVALRCAETLPVLYLELSRNFGKEHALTAGLASARGDVVLLLDADGQHPPQAVAAMLAQWQAGYDMVYAVRAQRSDDPWLKRLGVAFFYRFMRGVGGIDLPREASDFRLMDRKVVDALLSLPERNRFMKGMYAWIGFRQTGVEYTPLPRAHGQSSFSLWGLFKLALTGVTAFTNFPLRLVSGFGLVISALAMLYGLWTVVGYFTGRPAPPGYATLAVSIMLLSGLNLIAIGIVGEYLGRVFNEVKGRPNYIVAERVDAAGGPPP